MRVQFLRRRDVGVSLLREIPDLKVNVPQGAFYLFPDAGAYLGRSAGGRVIGDIGELAMYLLETANVATVGGAAFGAPRCLRLSYATSEDNLTEAIRRIKAALLQLK